MAMLEPLEPFFGFDCLDNFQSRPPDPYHTGFDLSVPMTEQNPHSCQADMNGILCVDPNALMIENAPYGNGYQDGQYAVPLVGEIPQISIALHEQQEKQHVNFEMPVLPPGTPLASMPRKWSCDCHDMSFNTKGELTKHQRRNLKHTPRRDWKYPCGLCDKRFLYPKDLKRHVKRHFKRRENSLQRERLYEGPPIKKDRPYMPASPTWTNSELLDETSDDEVRAAGVELEHGLVQALAHAASQYFAKNTPTAALSLSTSPIASNSLTRKQPPSNISSRPHLLHSPDEGSAPQRGARV